MTAMEACSFQKFKLNQATINKMSLFTLLNVAKNRFIEPYTKTYARFSKGNVQ